MRLLAHAIFETPANAMEAVNKLHAHVYKGSLLSATLKKRLDGLAKAAKTKPAKLSSSSPQKSTPTSKSGLAPNRNSRLIVRNLPFDVSEQDLLAIFLPYGPIHSVHIPFASDVKHEDDTVKAEKEEGKPLVHSKQRSKGFAFVWFLSRKDAEKAMEGCNGMIVEAGVAETLVSDKQKKKKQRREEKKLKAKAKAIEKGEDAAVDEDEDEGGGEGNYGKRTIAVDWALSKDKWEAEKAKLEEAQAQKGGEDVRMDGESVSSDSEDEQEESEGEENDSGEQLGVHDDDSGASGSDSDEKDSSAEEGDEDEEAQKPVKPTLPAPEVGTTVFIRNVPFEATEDELRTL